MSSKDESLANLHINLENIKNKEGIIGYILRNSKSASVDLNDPTKIIEYAMLSSELLEAGEVSSETFQLGLVNSIVVEGNNVKVILLVLGDQRLSIFMDKKADHNKIFKEFDLSKHSQKHTASHNQSSEENQEQNDIEAHL